MTRLSLLDIVCCSAAGRGALSRILGHCGARRKPQQTQQTLPVGPVKFYCDGADLSWCLFGVWKDILATNIVMRARRCLKYLRCLGRWVCPAEAIFRPLLRWFLPSYQDLFTNPTPHNHKLLFKKHVIQWMSCTCYTFGIKRLELRRDDRESCAGAGQECANEDAFQSSREDGGKTTCLSSE